MLVTEAVRVLKEVDATLGLSFITDAGNSQDFARIFGCKRNGWSGKYISPKVNCRNRSVRRFRNGKALVAFAGIDPPPYESGQFVGCNRKISETWFSIIAQSRIRNNEKFKNAFQTRRSGLPICCKKRNQKVKVKNQQR